MRPVAAGLLAALVVPAHAAAALDIRLSVRPARPTAGVPARVELRTFWPTPAGGLRRADPRGYPFRVEAVSPAGKVRRVRVTRAQAGLWAGKVTFGAPGRWLVRVTNYPPSYRYARVAVNVRKPEPTPPPAGFGPLGRPGCAPASPRNAAATTFPGIGEVFGTAVLGRLWALGFTGSWASPDAAVLEGVIGTRSKIVFRWSSPGFSVVAIAPDGRTVRPSNVAAHSSSTWNRPGWEWGTFWEFTEPGCWRISVRHGYARGSVYLDIRS